MEPRTDGRWVKRDLHASPIRFFHDFRDGIDLILQKQDIAFAKMAQGRIDFSGRNFLIGTPVNNDAILPARVNLNDRMTGFFR